MTHTYNFTIRAIDAADAYTDEAFSLTLSNTLIDTFITAGVTDSSASSDGNTFRLRTGQSGTIVINGNGLWLMMTTNSSAYKTSTDGINWTTQAPVPGTGLYGNTLAYGNGFYVLNRQGVDQVMTSTTGTPFVLGDNAGAMGTSSQNTVALAYGNGVWIAPLATASAVYNYSNSLVHASANFVSKNFNIGNNVTATDVKYFNGNWYIVDSNTGGSNARVLISSDGLVWITSVLPAMDTNSSAYRIAYGNGRLVVSQWNFGATANNANSHVFTSDNGGTTWTSRSVSPAFSTATGTSTSNVSIAYANGMFVAVNAGTGSTGYYVSKDAINWTQVAAVATSANYSNNIGVLAS